MFGRQFISFRNFRTITRKVFLYDVCDVFVRLYLTYTITREYGNTIKYPVIFVGLELKKVSFFSKGEGSDNKCFLSLITIKRMPV